MKETLKQISDLVDRFQRDIDAYHSPAYNETQLSREFIDPFFEALGWDVANKEGHAEQYKDVIHEDAIKVAGAQSCIHLFHNTRTFRFQRSFCISDSPSSRPGVPPYDDIRKV
jgi:hypothetical protein